jgi:hypothetical protein
MSSREDARDDLKRLERALDALAADLDAIERRPHLLLRRSAEVSQDGPRGIEGFVDHFAVAVERARSGSGL